MTQIDVIDSVAPPRHTTLYIALVAAAVCLLLLSFVAYVMLRPAGSSLSVEEVILQARSGNYEAALVQRDALLKDASTPAQTARATLNAHGAAFKISGDIQDRLNDIQKQQAIANDTSIDLNTRVYAINNLASAFCGSGRNPLVFKSIYSVAPFNTYLAPGDPNLSSRQLHEWSFSLMPTSKAATRIARWYVENGLWHTDLPASVKQEDTKKAEQYIQQADTLVIDELQGGTFGHSTNSKQYASYLYWRALDIGGLAKLVGEPYMSQYKKAFDDFFSFIDSTKNASTDSYLPYAHLFYAKYLALNDKDANAAKRELQKAIDFVKADPHPEVEEFAIFIQNERMLKPWDFSSQAIVDMENLYPAFKTFVQALDTSSGTSAVSAEGVDYAEILDAQ